MDHVVVCLAAFVGGAVSLLCGFGLNVILLPAFALCFPQPIAFAGFAVTQLVNDLVKAALMRKRVDWPCVLAFGLPVAIGGLLGSNLVGSVAKPLVRYTLLGRPHLITVPDVSVAAVLLLSAILPLLRISERLSVNRRYQPVGGAIVGVLGGLCGYFGALRGTFLINAGLQRDAFIATSVYTALVQDVTRVSVFGLSYILPGVTGVPEGGLGILIATSLSASLGSFLAVRYRKSVSLRGIHILVGILLVLSALTLGTGLI